METRVCDKVESHEGGSAFLQTLAERGLALTRGETTTLQVNMGLLCNQECRHCHLVAGPSRKEIMDAKTVDEVVDYARRGGFSVVDITGGAPEMNPNLAPLIERIAGFIPRIMLRSNLTAISSKGNERLMELAKEKKVVIFASMPSLNRAQSEAQRGEKVFDRSVDTLKKLNAMGYGAENTGLELNLVSNPSGAFLPSASQESLEQRFRRGLERKWGIVFNNLYSFANVPLGRFRGWLEDSGNFESYIGKLAGSFNPCALEGVMCRNQVSVNWDGYLYDCDFNLANGLPAGGGEKIHVTEMEGPPAPGSPIAVNDYCYACTAGAGFTCGGAITE